MPDLPTLTVTQAQADRLLQVFPGTTQAEKVVAYRDWLRTMLRDMVKNDERRRLVDQYEVDIAASDATVANELSTI